MKLFRIKHFTTGRIAPQKFTTAARVRGFCLCELYHNVPRNCNLPHCKKQWRIFGVFVRYDRRVRRSAHNAHGLSTKMGGSCAEGLGKAGAAHLTELYSRSNGSICCRFRQGRAWFARDAPQSFPGGHWPPLQNGRRIGKMRRFQTISGAVALRVHKAHRIPSGTLGGVTRSCSMRCRMARTATRTAAEVSWSSVWGRPSFSRS